MYFLFLFPSSRVNSELLREKETGKATTSGRNVNVETNNNRAAGPLRPGLVLPGLAGKPLV
jgi:hypothetical protein